MALETLKEIKQIDGFVVGRMGTTPTEDEFIFINDSENTICFKIQNGPIRDVGINGCQVDQLISTAKLVIEGLNKNFQCRENSIAITKLEEALLWLEQRKKNREKRGVEGYSKS
jgi:hypothetical protein